MMKKSIFAVITALMFNLLTGVIIGVAAGISPFAVIGGGLLMYKVTGIKMAVQKEIWMSSLVDQLFADNSFISKAFNADEFVSGKTVHIPNAGVPSNVEKNRKSFPATVKTRTDVDLTFDLDEYTTDPIKIPHADTVELNYNKRESVLKNDKAKLVEEVANDFIYKWSPASGYVIRTTGDAVESHIVGSTGNRKLFVKADVKKAMTYFNKQNIPQMGRYMLIDADMQDQLLDSLTEKQLDNFNKLADVSNGIIGKLYTFNFMMRSKAGRYTSALVPKEWTTASATTDHAAAIAWQEGSVCRAMGQTEMFDDESNPLYYGDIYSFLVRAGGRPMRSGVEGLLAIVQANA
jgi:hypothetical protein